MLLSEITCEHLIQGPKGNRCQKAVDIEEVLKNEGQIGAEHGLDFITGCLGHNDNTCCDGDTVTLRDAITSRFIRVS